MQRAMGKCIPEAARSAVLIISERASSPASDHVLWSLFHERVALLPAPRFSPDSRKVVIDSPHGGEGRQMWLIDLSEVPRISRSS
jgi:hypothetical protein